MRCGLSRCVSGRRVGSSKAVEHLGPLHTAVRTAVCHRAGRLRKKAQTEQGTRAPTKILGRDEFSKVGIWPSINKVLF